ncbi:MAG: ABC transporter ATP-binding protein [Niameybacter sp.]
MKTLLLKRKWEFIIYTIASCFFIISDLLIMGVSSWVMDALEKGSMELFITRIIYGVVIVCVGAGLYLASRFLRIGYMRNVLLDIRKEAFRTVLQMTPKQFAKVSKENYVSRLTNDVNLIEEKFFVSLLNLISGGGMYLVGILIIAVQEPLLAGGILTVSAVCYILCKLFLARTEKLQEAVSEGNETLTLNMSNTFNGLEIIKLGNMEEKFLEKNKKEISRAEARKQAFNNYSEIQQNVLIFVGYFVMAAVIFYLGHRIGAGLGLGVAVFLFQLSTQIVFRIMDALPLVNVMRSSIKIYDKLTHLEVAQEETKCEPFVFKEHITLNQVSFGYEGRTLLDKACITLEKGKKYLIKGASGAGKSTLLKMLELLNEDYAGTIEVDGVDYRTIDERDFNDKVAVIDQDIFLFEDTIRNNISLYKSVEESCMTQAIGAAGLESVIQGLEEGLDTLLLENGKNLSGGQRQRIAIARAIAKEAEILFVDEGTASLNEALGREIEKVFLSLPQTVVAISHRYYEGVSEGYDYVLKLQAGRLICYDVADYFEGVSVC